MGGDTDILVVEDDDFIRDYVTEVLLLSGYRVKSAASGQEALDILGAGLRPGLLFTDVLMAGGMNGIELAREARQFSRDMKVLYTSGYTGGTGCEPLPADAEFLRKPFKRQECVEKVGRILNNHSGTTRG